MRKEQLIHEFEGGQYAHVYETLLDFKRFGKFHPVIVSVELLNDSSDSREYEIKEKVFLFGFIPMRPVYRATVSEPEKGKSIQYISAVKKNVDLQIIFTFHENGSVCHVKEDITVSAGGFVARIFMRLLKKMHLKTMENIRNNASLRP